MKALSPLLIFLFCLFSFHLQAQAPASGYLTAGLDGGWSYQSADIRPTLQGWGASASLGKSLFYRPGAFFGLEGRARLLYAQQLGLDPFRSFDIQNNDALNGTGRLDYVDYPANLNVPQGFVFQNHKTEVGELSVEGLLHLNKLREATNVVVALYGGVGLDWHRTRMDQADAFGLPYYDAYANLDTDQSNRRIRRSLRQEILDGSYETTAETYGDLGKFDIMPSVGFELGYAFTPGFALVGGHRTTFSGTDLLDGHQWKDSKSDRYHYTHLGLRWRIWTTARSKGKAPQINILLPTANPATTSNLSAFVRARILHVQSASDVRILVNGSPAPFDFGDGIFLTSIPLRPGRNEVMVYASNAFGQDQARLIFFHEGGSTIYPDPPRPRPGNRPVIRLINPSTNRLVTPLESITIRADIQSVNNKNDIRFFVNGNRTTDFLFDAGRNEFISSIPLFLGSNDITIRAENPYGSDEVRATIIRQRPESQQPPKITFLQPDSDPFTTSNSVMPIRATIDHVRNAQQISLSVNGQNLSNFEFGNGALTATLNLRPGNNTVRLRATNPAGQDEEDVVIIRQQALPPPTVAFEAPASNNITVRDRTYEVVGRLQHVSAKSDISLKMNGRTVTNFSFSAASGKLTYQATLTEGNNTFILRATNASGQDEATANVRLVSGSAPEVTIQAPAHNSTTTQSVVDLTGRVTQVRLKNDVQLFINGKATSNFTFDPRTGNVSARISLQVGNNTLRLTGKNAAGQDEAEVQVRRTSPQLPVVEITSPANNATVPEPSVAFVGKVENVRNKSDIRITLNGKTVPVFTWSPADGQVKATLSLRTGSNAIALRAVNADGSDQASVTVTYEKTGPKPMVTFIQPLRPGDTAEKNPAIVIAEIQHVAEASDIEFKVNGQPVRSFSFDKRTQRLTATVALKEGTNELSVKGTNAFGAGQATSSFRWQNQEQVFAQKPVIQEISITTPAPNPLNPNVALAKAEGRVTGIQRTDQFSATLNGQPLTSINLNLKNGAFVIDLALQKGRNVLVVQATNDAGVTSVERVVAY